MVRHAWFALLFVALGSVACEEEEDPVDTPWDAAGSWVTVQAVDTVGGVTTYVDYPLDQGGGVTLSVEYDLSTDGTYEVAAVTTEADGTTSAIVDPDVLTWWSTGDRSVRMLVTEGDPHVELDCEADDSNDDLLTCIVDIDSAYGGAGGSLHTVILERIP